MCFKRFSLFFLVVSYSSLSIAQNCTISVRGIITDQNSTDKIEFANIYIEETKTGAVADEFGYFEINKLCAGNYHLIFSHIGCETQQLFLNLKKDTILEISMNHNAELLESINITNKNNNDNTSITNSLNKNFIQKNANENFGNLLSEISGVSALQTGAGISKPVINGLYGNRITVLNNGIPQNGQQWGNDHSVEIDPLSANNIQVVSGTDALAYQGSSLGSIVVVNPEEINNEPHLHGKVSYFFESNGFGNGVNAQLSKYNKFFGWKINSTLKKSGDRRTPNYWLRNTGAQEGNISVQLEKKFSEKIHTELYFSTFNTSIGILRGAHIGNITDLERAFTASEPFFTQENFSYNIEAPKQKVSHNLLKTSTKINFTDKKWLELTYAAQLNKRKEFDVRRSGRSEIPALSLNQLSQNVEVKYNNYFNQEDKLTTGIQGTFTDNTNNPETNILPLIPDYNAYKIGAFLLYNKTHKKITFLTGARYDSDFQNVATISTTVPREIIRYLNHFKTYAVSSGLNYKPLDNWKIIGNLGYILRNPAINELYSNGLHQGVSGIEEGQINLKTEKAINTNIELQGTIKQRLKLTTQFHFQHIENYIFLEPQNEVRLTIRGAFPVFKYKNTNAQIVGVDTKVMYQITEQFRADANYSYIRGWDKRENIPLINMPANQLEVGVQYEIGKWKKLEKIQIGLKNRFVFRQNNLLDSQDFLPAPDAYNLLSSNISSEIQLKKIRLTIYSKLENMLNTQYREYLNRQRYFADELGINCVLGCTVSF